MPAMVTLSCIPAKYKIFTIWPFLERAGEPSDACEGIVDGLRPPHLHLCYSLPLPPPAWSRSPPFPI